MGEPKVTSEQLPMAGKYRHQIGGNHGFDRKKKGRGGSALAYCTQYAPLARLLRCNCLPRAVSRGIQEQAQATQDHKMSAAHFGMSGAPAKGK